MAWQPEVGSGSARATDYRDFVIKLIDMMTSQHVATVVVGSTGGTGYAIGDLVKIVHASAHLEAVFEVLTLSGSAIATMKINANGAFAQQAVSATVPAGGSGYIMGDILEVQGGSSRQPAKFSVATLSGSAVATVTLFESGGVYSSTPSNPAATKGIGPSTFAGDDLATLTVTYQALITPLTDVTLTTVTGGGSGANADITLAQSGWSVDGRNTNSRLENSVDFEKEVVLKGDASGITNKPYVGMISWTRTSGINTRYGVAMYGMVAHNSALPFHQSPILSKGINTTTGALLTGAHLLFSEDQAQAADFWFSVDDRRVMAFTNNNPAAVNTDNGEYLRMYMGLTNAYGTEIENPYPMLIGASSRDLNINPAIANQSISGFPECIGPTGSAPGWSFYESENSVWRDIENGEALAASTRPYIMYPFGDLKRITDTGSADLIVDNGPLTTYDTWSTVTRGSPARKLRPIPGTTPEHFLWAINIVSRNGPASSNNVEDTPRGELRGAFFTTATDSTGAVIANFSEDTITIGSDRYRVFHNHVHTQRYQYVAVKEDV